MQKAFLILLLLGTAAPAVHSQQKTVHHLLVTLYESTGLIGTSNLIE